MIVEVVVVTNTHTSRAIVHAVLIRSHTNGTPSTTEDVYLLIPGLVKKTTLVDDWLCWFVGFQPHLNVHCHLYITSDLNVHSRLWR